MFHWLHLKWKGGRCWEASTWVPEWFGSPCFASDLLSHHLEMPRGIQLCTEGLPRLCCWSAPRQSQNSEYWPGSMVGGSVSNSMWLLTHIGVFECVCNIWMNGWDFQWQYHLLVMNYRLQLYSKYYLYNSVSSYNVDSIMLILKMRKIKLREGN